MDEPRTHYQLSFTARQALLLFVALIGSLAVAYAFGLMTGLAGRPRETAAATETPVSSPASDVPAAAVSPSPSPGETLDFPRAVRGISPGTVRPPRTPSETRVAASVSPVPRIAAAAPTPSPGLQLFEDAPVSEPTAAPAGTGPIRRPEGSAAGKPTARPAVRTPPAPAVFWVQALSASNEKEARQRRDRLTAHGFPATVFPGPGPGPGGRVYRVRVGPFASREEAEREAAQLKSREKLQPWVVPPGK